MPRTQKRSVAESALISDSSDDDYTESDHQIKGTGKSREQSKTKKRPTKKRQRVNYVESESEIGSTDSDHSLSSVDSEGDHFIEKNARGVAKRTAAKRVEYHDPTSTSSDSGEEDGDISNRQNGDKGSGPQNHANRKRLVVKFPISTPACFLKGSNDNSVDNGNEVRRSTRQTCDEARHIVALSNSGSHVDVIRRATGSPELTSKVHAPSLPENHNDEPSDCNKALDETRGQFAPYESPNGNSHQIAAENDKEVSGLRRSTERALCEESNHWKGDNDDDESPRPAKRRHRNSANEQAGSRPKRHSVRLSVRRRAQQDEGSDFEPNEQDINEDNMSDSEISSTSLRRESQDSNEVTEGKVKQTSRSQRQTRRSRADSGEAEELAEELAELRPQHHRRRAQASMVYESKPRRSRKSVDYRIIRPELMLPIEEDDNEADDSSSRRTRGGRGSGWQRTLFPTSGPFGGIGGPQPLFGDEPGMGALGPVESDSSDEESGQRLGAGGIYGSAPATAFAPGASQGLPGAVTNFGKIKEHQTSSDSDPLGVNANINFDGVGGLQEHIDRLKEMVSLPLLYPEIFQRFHIVPPRGVLFHGPPGTGKTLLARALANSVSSGGQKVTFYMRKGADTLSKWVGEAERQLRLLFEDARESQPSIIFFDEIDGLAPVRSSKQEQIHASIVSTLLALMDGMDGRGQVIVIGATNRPDSVDPALRRPGRFDREFYFPLPNISGRRAILDIHTKNWDPPLSEELKIHLAESTKGYGGADLRALCTEAALNAVQRKYPQIYRSDEKLLIDVKKIHVTWKDFSRSIQNIVPSSERSNFSIASPLPTPVRPLLQHPLRDIERKLCEILPSRPKQSALEEAQYEEDEDQFNLRSEKILQTFHESRIFRPRLLIRGHKGMGQQYIAAALLHYFEGIHVQSIDLPSLLSDPAKSVESSLVHLFAEAKRHKPSVIYVPDIHTWPDSLGQTTVSVFLELIRSISSADPILLLGIQEGDCNDTPMVKSVFGASSKSYYNLTAPKDPWRYEFFEQLISFIKMAPSEFPDPENRKKKKLEDLPIAPPPSPKPIIPTREEIKTQKKRDRQTLSILKIRIQPIMDQIKKYKRFRTGVIEESRIKYLFEEADPNSVSADDSPMQDAESRPFERDIDKHGVLGLRDIVSNKFFYNLEIVTVERRLSNGYYKRPKDFLRDIKFIAKDARQLGDQDRLLKANELLSNVEVDIANLEQSDPALVAECENVYLRDLMRQKMEHQREHDTMRKPGSMAPPPSHSVDNPSSFTRSCGGYRSVQYNDGSVHNSSQSNRIVRNARDCLHPEFLVENGTDDGITMSNSESHGRSNGRNTAFLGSAAQPRPALSYTAPSQQLQQRSGLSSMSQKGVMMPMAPESQPHDYGNDASTTQTTSERMHSGPSTEPLYNKLQHHNLGKSEDPDIVHYPDRVSNDERLPDTQGGESGSWGSPKIPSICRHDISSGSYQSQPHIPVATSNPVFLLNSKKEVQSAKLRIDDLKLRELHDALTENTKEFSVEQLEHINMELLGVIWRMRHEWDRFLVAASVRDAFFESVKSMQNI